MRILGALKSDSVSSKYSRSPARVPAKMASQIHLIRHAESVHNVTKDFGLIDPLLTELGVVQASKLADTFTPGHRVAFVFTSPLRRAIQTTLSAFTNVLDKTYYPSSSNEGVENGAQLVVDPYLQESSSLGCDTGSSCQALKTEFPYLDLSDLGERWPSKDGIFSVEQGAVEERAREFRHRLAKITAALEGTDKRDVAIVTHGVFMKILSGELNIDLPKAGWKSFTLQKDEQQGAVLVSG